jgi:hypothetical protein
MNNPKTSATMGTRPTTKTSATMGTRPTTKTKETKLSTQKNKETGNNFTKIKHGENSGAREG